MARSSRMLRVLFRRLLGDPSSSPGAAEDQAPELGPVSSRSSALLDTTEGDCVSEQTADTRATASPVAPPGDGASTPPRVTPSVSAAAPVPPPRPAIVPAQAPEPASSLPASLSPAAESSRSDSGCAASEGLPAHRHTDLALVRAWARENGYTVADRGRIAAAVLAAYDRAH